MTGFKAKVANKDFAEAPADLNKLTSLLEQLNIIDLAIEDYEAKIKMLKAQRLQIETEAMIESMGPHKEVVIDNKKFVRYHDVTASIRSGQNEKAIAWLDEKGLSSIVTHQVVVKDKGKEGQATINKVCDTLIDEDIAFDKKVDIHFQTMGKTMRDLHAKGETIPEEIFSTKVTERVKILKKR